MHESGGVNLFEDDFYFAFGVRNYLKDEYKHDANHVQWQVRIFEGDGEKSDVKHTILTHRCTDEEWNKFASPKKHDIEKFNRLKKRDVLHCLNNLDVNNKPYDAKVWGPDDGRDHRRFDIVLQPCK
jgi:hypothetical protein